VLAQTRKSTTRAFHWLSHPCLWRSRYISFPYGVIRCNTSIFEHGSFVKSRLLGYPVESVKGTSAVCKGSMWTQARWHIHYSRRRRIPIALKGTRKTPSSMQTNSLLPGYGYLCSEHAHYYNLHNTRFRNNWAHFLRNRICQALAPWPTERLNGPFHASRLPVLF
jgi:hypothetical protein